MIILTMLLNVTSNKSNLIFFSIFTLFCILTFTPVGLCVIKDSHLDTLKPKSFTIQDIWKEGFLWGVPKHRRNVAKRRCRKFGWPQHFWKPFIPKTNLLMCRGCGHFHESHTICNYCYEIVKKETIEIQKVMEKEFKLDPIKDNIVVLYNSENQLKSEEYWKNQRVIEMPKKRPSWFHHNLLESTSQKLSESKDIKPNDIS